MNLRSLVSILLNGYIYDLKVHSLKVICSHTSITIVLHRVKSFKVLLCITNNSIKQSFVYPQLNDQTVLFLTIQFSIIHLFAQFKCQTVLFDSLIGPYHCDLLNPLQNCSQYILLPQLTRLHRYDSMLIVI